MTAPELRQWRTAVNITQEAAAQLLGVTERTWQRWESGKTPMPPFLYRALRDLERDLARDRRMTVR